MLSLRIYPFHGIDSFQVMPTLQHRKALTATPPNLRLWAFNSNPMLPMPIPVAKASCRLKTRQVTRMIRRTIPSTIMISTCSMAKDVEEIQTIEMKVKPIRTKEMKTKELMATEIVVRKNKRTAIQERRRSTMDIHPGQHPWPMPTRNEIYNVWILKT